MKPDQKDNRYNIIQKVIDGSESSDWTQAVLEWQIDDYEEDIALESSCICGKDGLRHIYHIQNNKNGNRLYPIGSLCISKFRRQDLQEDVLIIEQMFKLLHEIEENKFIKLSPELFSRKLLKHLNNQGAFKASTHNNNNPEADYEFLLKMFNKRKKDRISEKQNKKIAAIMINSIKPYLRGLLNDKIKRNPKP